MYTEMVMIIGLSKHNINLSSESIKRMERASDNKYLRDFHISMNLLMNYIYDTKNVK